MPKSEDKKTLEKGQGSEQSYVELLLQDMESAAILGCSVPTVWRRRKDGTLNVVRISSGCVRDKLSDVMALAGVTSPAEISAQAQAILRLRMEQMRQDRSARWKRQEEKRKAARRAAA